MSNATELAYPARLENVRPDYAVRPGLTKREHAAILLRVERSGDADIDAMIREANRRDAAAMAMQAYSSSAEWRETVGPQETARCAVTMADALSAELERRS